MATCKLSGKPDSRRPGWGHTHVLIDASSVAHNIPFAGQLACKQLFSYVACHSLHDKSAGASHAMLPRTCNDEQSYRHIWPLEQHDPLTPWSLLAFHHQNSANLDQLDQPKAALASLLCKSCGHSLAQHHTRLLPVLTSPLPVMALTCKQHAHSSCVVTQSMALVFRQHTEQVYPELLVLKHLSEHAI